MDFGEKDDMKRDLEKVRRNQKIYIAGGFGLVGLGVVLIVLFIVWKEIPALLLGVVGIVWGGLLLNQALKTREMEEMIISRIAASEEIPVVDEAISPGEEPGGDPGERDAGESGET